MIYKKYILLLCLVLQTTLMFAQELQTLQRVELGINGLVTSLEIPLSSNFVIEPSIGFGPSYDIDKNQDGLTSKIDYQWALLEPSVHTALYGKLFVLRNSRERKGKSLRLNSGSYIGVKVKYVSKPLTSDHTYRTNTLLTNVNWGGQFNIGSHWNYGYSIGLGLAGNLDYSSWVLYPAFDIKIAYVLPLFDKK